MKNIIVLFFTLAFLNGFAQSDYFWVGGTGNWTETTHWATTSGGTDLHVTIPTSSDNIYFDANSFNAAGQTVTVDITGDLCKSMDWSGATNSPTFNVNSKKINIAGSLTLIPEMSWSGNNINLGTTFTSTQASNSIATAGHNLGRLWFDGPGAEWNLTDNVDGYEILITSGVLNTQNFDISLSAGARGIKLQSPSSTHDKGIRLGTSTVTLANGQNVAWDLTGAEVVEASESTIIITGYRNDCCGNYFKGGDHIYNDLIFTSDKSDAGGYWQIEGDNTFNTITYTTDAKLTGSNTINTLNLAQGSTYTFTAGKTQTIGTITGSGDCISGTSWKSSSTSSQTNISIASGTFNLDYFTIQGLNITGGATVNMTNVVDQGNNTGVNIISTTGATNKNLYWVGGSGNWTNGNNWSETSGGTAYGCKPNATDNIYFDANSFNAAGQTVTVDITGDLCKSMDWSGATNSPTFNVNSKKINIAGSLTLIPEMSWSGNNINLGTTFTSTQASNSIATAGHNLGRLWFDGPGAEWNLTDNVDGYEILITSGVLNTQNFDISLSAGARGIKLQSPSSTHDKGIRLGTSTVTLANGQNVAWDLTGAEVVEASESTIIITGYRNDCCGNYFKGGDHIYNDLIFTSDKSDAGGYWQIEGDNTFNTITYTTDAKLTGSNTINTLNLAQGSTYTFTAGKTQTILSDLNANGISNFPVTVKSSNSNPTLIDIPTASVCSDYMAIENVHVINYGYFDAGANSTNQGSNAGILFDGLCTFNPKPMLGTGTETDPFQIANFDHLLWLSDNGGSSQHFLQTADIDASTSSTLNSGLGFSPIAFNASVYNGAGYKISNLFMDRPNSNSDGHTAGVFGLVDNGSVIKNVSIVDADITGYQLVGVIAGELKGDSYLLTSYATGLLESDGRQTGALVGNMRGGSVKNCYSNVYMTRFGSSYPLGTITGNNYGNDLIENCYSIGGGTPITPISYYSGGNAAIKNSFYLDTHTYTGSNWCNNCVESGETSKSETEMKTVSTYIASGWDFTGENTNGTDDVWVEDIDGSVNNGYPYLAMQKGTPAFTETYVDVNPIDDILVNSNTPVVVNISSINNSGGNTVFSATSSNETVSTVSISNSSTTGNETTADLTITNVGEGKSQIYVYGSNPNNRDGGASFFVYEADYTAPSAALTFKVGLDVVSSVSVTEVLLITADFSEPLNDSPVVQIGSNAFSAQNMTKVSDTKYTYEWDAPDNTASGDITFSLSTGTDLSGNVVTSVPTSGTSIFLELASELPLGSGSEEDPYLISSISNLLWLSENGGSSQHFLQTADIDASTSSTLNSGLGFSPIAFNASVYNGAGYKISNLFMDRPNSNSDGHTAGVFGLVDNGSVIKNVSIVDADITGYQLVGVIAGELKGDSYLLTSYATGLLESDGRQTGALVGNMRGGSVKNCYSNVYMTRFGSSYPLGTITGNNYGNDLIENCYSIGGGTPITPISYYSGGNAAIKNSFYLDTHTYTGSNWCNNCVESGETSKSETEMKTVSTYIASGWDFIDENTNGTDDVWMIDENGIINNGFPYFNPDIYTPADTTVPVITLTGDAAVTIEVDATYADAGASALDNYDGNITNSISVVNPVNTAVVGEYTITYNVSDAAGNNAVQVTRTVNVVDTTVPVITLTGDAAVTIEVDATYTDAGASALDNYDGNITNSISVVNPVNTAVVGEYTITYNVSDAAGNNAVQVTRTVNVVDTTVPVITLTGDAAVTIEVDATYADAGASALDNYDGNITNSISVVNPVNTAVVGEYTITYNVSDAAGNNAVQVTRTVNVVDTTVPVITLTGDAAVTIEVDATYADAGASALDNYDGNITNSISVVNPVNTAVVGEYTITYNVSDAAGNNAVQVTRTVNVVDTTVPVITLTGDAAVTIEVDATYTDAGASALDNYDGNITNSISVVNPVNTAVVGEYTITYNVSDAAGNNAVQVTRTVNVVDTTVPVITLTGDAAVTIEVDATYADAGASALDNYDGNITNSISVVNPVNTAVVGEYTITYNVSDAAGNNAVQVTRTVNVVDTTVPVITLTGDAAVTIEVDATYADAGASALDNYDGNITNSISVVNPVNTAVVGEYTITYNVSDAAGNNAVQVTRTVNVVDTTVPVITLTGDAAVTIEVDATYTDAGASALDNYDGNITNSISVVNPVNTAVVGEYTITYNVSDAAGNNAVQVTRTVNVVDTTVPVITLTGDAAVTIEVNATYTDAGASALDNYDGNITNSISVVNPVNTAVVGEYTITYNVSDAAGNNAVQVTRTVNVVEILGLDSTELNKVSVYPNPTASKWTIESSTIIKTLTLFNLLGQKVLEQTANEMEFNIDVSDLKTGVYLLKINNTTIKRVIKK